MFSTLKLIILTIASIIGLKHFKQEIFQDVGENPLQYSASLFTGMFTYFNLSTPMTSLVTEELIKSGFAIFNAVMIFVIVFIVKKIIDPLYDQKIKSKLHKWFNIKSKE